MGQSQSNNNNLINALSQSLKAKAAQQASPAPILPQAINFIQASAPPVPDPAALCTTNKITLANLENQMEITSQKVDNCDPNVKVTRNKAKYLKENRAFADTERTKYNTLKSSIYDRFNTATDLVESTNLLKQFRNELTTQYTNARKEKGLLTHEERTYRRDFLDNDPEEGVPWHIVGLQTADDKAMLAFWSSSLVTLILIAYFLISTMMSTTTLWPKIGAGLGIVIVPLIVFYIIIVNYG
jgi:hypothetical protein